MSRSIVIVVRTISFCVLANVVCGSQYYYWSNERSRNPRHASCPSCHRDCPDALSSPWYSRESYDEISPSRNYRSFDGRSYGEWTPSGSLSTFHPRNGYGRSSRSGSANSMDVTASGTTNTQQYREPFENRQLRRIDPYLASKPTTPSLSQGSSHDPYPFAPMTNSFINSNYERQNYQPRKFGQEFADRSINFGNGRGYNVDRSNRHNQNSYRNKPIEVSSLRKDVVEDYPKASPEKFLVVYRADRNAEQFDGEEEDTLPFERSDSADEFKESKITSRSEDIDGPFSNIDLNSFHKRYATREKESFPTSNVIREAEIKRKVYDSSPRSNVGRTMQDSRNLKRDEYPVQLWQDDRELSDEETDKSLESLTRRNDYYVSPINGEVANESTRTIQNDVSNNEEEKLLAEQAIKITETKGETIEEASLKFDPDLMEDIENPPVEPTEPTPTNEPAESSMTEKHSR